MNTKTLFRTLILVALLFGMVGNTQAVYAEDPPPAPSVSIAVDPTSINVEESTILTVSLNDIPAEGYASAEIACTYPVDLVSVGNTTEKGLFGADPVTASVGAVNGSFIYAIAGKNGIRATAGGAVIELDITALQVAGDATLECVAKVSTGDGTLTELPAASTVLTITRNGFINGKAVGTKAVSVTLYDAENNEIIVSVDAEGVFSESVPAGTYFIKAESLGHLNAENASVVVVSGEVTDMVGVTLLAGDIAGDAGNPDEKIDQLDAMSIGMNYNLATPAIADLNGDGIVNVLDLELIADNYQAAGALPWDSIPN